MFGSLKDIIGTNQSEPAFRELAKFYSWARFLCFCNNTIFKNTWTPAQAFRGFREGLVLFFLLLWNPEERRKKLRRLAEMRREKLFARQNFISKNVLFFFKKASLRSFSVLLIILPLKMVQFFRGAWKKLKSLFSFQFFNPNFHLFFFLKIQFSSWRQSPSTQKKNHHRN